MMAEVIVWWDAVHRVPPRPVDPKSGGTGNQAGNAQIQRQFEGLQGVTSFHGTTILSVRRGSNVVMGGDGQVTLGQTVMKANARKVRRTHHGKVLAGFAGATADAFTLFEKFDEKLDEIGRASCRERV